MYSFCIELSFILTAVQFLAVTAKLSISLSEVDITDLPEEEPVKIIEGDSLLLRCASDNNSLNIVWHRNNVNTVNNTIWISQIRHEDAGEYVCRAVQHISVAETKTILLEVLYPPSYPFIEGETTGLYGEQVTLKCLSEAMPAPTYEWRRANQNGALLTRNQTLQTEIHKDISAIVCIVKSIMVSTLGKSENVRSTRRTVIHANEKAIVEKVYNHNGDYWNVKKGDDVDIRCVASGTPTPKIWWTKVGNISFFFEGDRLTEHKTDTIFEGDYICHAQNTISSVNKSSKITEDTKTVNLKVIKPSARYVNCKPEDCIVYCEKHPPVTTFPRNFTPSNDYEEAKPDMSNKELVLIIAIVVGWTAFGVCLFIRIVVQMKKKKEIETQKVYNQKTPKRQSQASDSPGNSFARSFSGSYISEVRLPDHTYMDLYMSDPISQRYSDVSALDSTRRVTSDSTYLKPIYNTPLVD